MKIKQNFMPICDDCPNIKPDILIDSIYANGFRTIGSLTVYCKNECLCRTLMSYLKSKEEK